MVKRERGLCGREFHAAMREEKEEQEGLSVLVLFVGTKEKQNETL